MSAGGFLDAVLASLEGVRRHLPGMAAAGDAVATRLAGGGRLLLASVRPDFVSEGFVRSGGLMLLEEWAPDRAGPEDAVIAGWTGTDPEADRRLLRQVSAAGALTVGIGPEPSTSVDWHLPLAVPLDADLAPFGGAAYPVLSLQGLLVLWALTGEVVAALTRRGLMPAIYQSVLVPGARERNARCSASPFHDRHAVPPLPPGRLGAHYLDGMAAILRALVDEELADIEQVGAACARVHEAGGTIHAGLISHYPMYQSGAPGDPGYMRRLSPLSGETPSVEEIRARVGPGDLLFFLGYYRRPAAAYEAARQAGAQIVEVITGDGVDAGPRPDLRIRPRWPFGDAVVPVPGYDVDILPSSGIGQTAIFWAVVAAIGQALSP